MLTSVQEVVESNTVLENQVQEAKDQTTASEQKNAELVKNVEDLTKELNKAKEENKESVAKIAAAFKLADVPPLPWAGCSRWPTRTSSK